MNNQYNHNYGNYNYGENDNENGQVRRSLASIRFPKSLVAQKFSRKEQAEREARATKYQDEETAKRVMVQKGWRRGLLFGAGGGNIIMDSSSGSVRSSSSSSLTYHIGLGTIVAVIICSSLVLSIVIMVAYKKITKIYTNNRNMAYGTLEEEQ